MIHVARMPLPAPLQTSLQEATTKLLVQLERVRNERQTRPEFDAGVWQSAREHAKALFRGKCAYCETPIAPTSPGDIDHFRPTLGAMNFDKRQDPFHYAWLAYEWENLYPVCHFCGRNKRSQFPVEEDRAPFGSKGPALRASENPLLLDPCDPNDDPEEHLAFNLEVGFVEGKSPRGMATIQVLGLNRPSIIEARRFAHVSARAQLESIVTKTDAESKSILDLLAHPGVHYAAVVRATVALYTQPKKKKPKGPAVKPSVAAPNTETGYITSILIENFRPVRELSLRVRPGSSANASWLMLLGENGAGKSSILQAVALALLGRDGLAAIPDSTHYDDLINNDAEEARIRLTMTAEPYAIDVRLQRGKPPKFMRGAAGCPSLVLAYGPIRLAGRLAEGLPKTSDSTADRRVANLFDSRTPLIPSEAWLTSLSVDEFDFAVKTLRDLLHLTKTGDTFCVRDGGVELERANGKRERLDQLSAGFGAVIALAVDIMQAAPAVMIDKKFAAGIVLLDEVDAHLHPRWKMDVVRALRDAFPNLQFIACTHEPLCLRGLRQNEVAVIRLDEAGEVEAITKLPSPENLRIDQLLTSQLFGLHTTLDPEIERAFRRYYDLLGNPSRSEPENEELDKLAAVVDRHGVLGYTRRDRLVYEAIDDYLKRESKLSKPEKLKLRKDTRRTVLRLWRSAEAWLERRS